MAKATAKEKTDVKGTILTAYIDFSLEHETAPKSVYKFCKELAIDEATFFGLYNLLYDLKAKVDTQAFRRYL